MDKKQKAKAALEFIRDHPAIYTDQGGDLFDGAWFYMAEVCKNGRCEGDVSLSPYGRDKKKYAHLFEKHDPDFKDIAAKNWYEHTIYVPYEEVYGEPWKYHHTEYWLEFCSFIFTGDPYGDVMEHSNRMNWQGYCGGQVSARSFESLIIKAAAKIKEYFGDFRSYDLHTEEEKRNWEENQPILFWGGSDGIGRQVTFNADHVDVGNGLLNLRWLARMKKNPTKHMAEWFKDDGYEEFLGKLDNVPKERAELLGRKSNIVNLDACL